MEKKESLFAGRIRGIDHITLPVGDLETAERFYVGVLGAKVVMRVTEEMLVSMGRGADIPRAQHITLQIGDSPKIDLFPQGHGWPAATQDHPHVAFQVSPDDILALQTILEDNGCVTHGPRRIGPPGHASLYFYDPFGNHLELTCMGFYGEAEEGPPDLQALARRRAGRA